MPETLNDAISAAMRLVAAFDLPIDDNMEWQINNKSVELGHYVADYIYESFVSDAVCDHAGDIASAMTTCWSIWKDETNNA